MSIYCFLKPKPLTQQGPQRFTTMPRVGRAFVWRPKRDATSASCWRIGDAGVLMTPWLFDLQGVHKSAICHDWHGWIPWGMCLLNQIEPAIESIDTFPLAQETSHIQLNQYHMASSSVWTVWADGGAKVGGCFNYQFSFLMTLPWIWRETPTAAVWVQASQAEKTISACHGRASTTVRDPAVGHLKPVTRHGQSLVSSWLQWFMVRGWFGMTIHHENPWLR